MKIFNLAVIMVFFIFYGVLHAQSYDDEKTKAMLLQIAMSEKVYTPQSEQSYRSLKEKISLSDADIEDSIKLSKSPENIKIINAALAYLKYMDLIDSGIKLPPIYIYSAKRGNYTNNLIVKMGGFYSSQYKIVCINGSVIKKDNNSQAQNFINIAETLAHELKHQQDHLLRKIPNILSENAGYKKSAQVCETVLKMSAKEAEVIPASDLYSTIQNSKRSIRYHRQYFLYIAKAADIIVRKKDIVCKKLNIEPDIFYHLSRFNPSKMSNDKTIEIEVSFSNDTVNPRLSVDIDAETVKILNSKEEIDLFNRQIAELRKKYNYSKY